jgi:hypothetical protein
MNTRIGQTLIIAVVIIIAVYMGTHAVTYRSRAEETITVTGLAQKDFNSDLIVWTGSWSRKSTDLKSAYMLLKGDENMVRDYLLKKGITNSEMVISSVNIDKQFTPKLDKDGKNIGQEFTGYELTQSVTIQSTDIDRIDKVSREATELIESGIELNSSSPAFYNTKLTQVKMELLAKASADARSRAEAIAENAGSKLGKLKKATMGVFQITGRNSNEGMSSGGDFDTANRYKTGSITIKMEFSVN